MLILLKVGGECWTKKYEFNER